VNRVDVPFGMPSASDASSASSSGFRSYRAASHFLSYSYDYAVQSTPAFHGPWIAKVYQRLFFPAPCWPKGNARCIWCAPHIVNRFELKLFWFSIVAAAEIFLQPEIQADEHIAATHFPELKLRDARPAISPGNRDDRPGVASDDRL